MQRGLDEIEQAIVHYDEILNTLEESPMLRASLADLTRRRERLEAAGSAAAREYSEYIWFEEVRWRADAAFLAEQIVVLERLTGASESADP